VLGQALNSAPTDPRQVWIVTLPEGRARRVTSDTNGFMLLDGTPDGQTLMAMQQRILREVWAAPAASPDAGTRILAGDWDFRVSAASASLVILEQFGVGIWSIRPDGSDLRRLTPESFRQANAARVDWASSTVYFDGMRDDGVWHVWRMTTDGRDIRQVTPGDTAMLLALAADGQSLLFVNRLSREQPAWRMPVSGGDPQPVEDLPTPVPFFLGYSPDGRYRLRWDSPNWVLEPATGGTEIRRWPARANTFAWSPTANGIDFMARDDGNIWRMPLAGGEPRQLTHVTSPGLQSFAWANDGSTLFYSRSVETTKDVVLLTNFRPDGKTP